MARNSLISIVLIPTIAKIFHKIQNPLILQIFEQEIILNIELPFNWVILFLAGICFLIASVIHELFCPTLIKEFKYCSDFKKSGSPFSFVTKTAQDLGINSDMINNFHLNLESNKENQMQMSALTGKGSIDYEETATRIYQNFFFKVHEYAKFKHLLARLVACVFLAIAIISICFIIVEGCIFVFS